VIFTMLKKMSLFLVICWVLAIGCTPYTNTRVLNPITVQPVAEKKIFIQTDPKETELVLITKPLEEHLTAKGYALVETPEKAAYTVSLHLVYLDYRDSRPRRTYGVAMNAGGITGGLVGGATGSVIGFGAGSLLSGSDSVPFVGKVEVTIKGKDSAPQETTVSSVAKVRHENQESSKRQAVAQALAKKIAELMP